MPEACLLSIIDAANPDDEDDLTTRCVIVLMLRESGLGLADLFPAPKTRRSRRSQASPPSQPWRVSRLPRLVAHEAAIAGDD